MNATSLPGRALLRHAFVPALLAWALVPWLRYSVNGAKALAPSILVSCVLGVWMAEQLYPRNPAWNARPFSQGMAGLRSLAHSLIYVFGVTQVTAWVIARVDPYVRPQGAGLVLWPNAAPFAARVLLAFLLAEFASYWLHRAAHRVRLLWQFHSTHHVIAELNGLKALQTHPLDDLAFHLARTVPLLWLGAGVDEGVAALYFGGVLGVLAHANLHLSDRGWGLFLNLPRAHSVHHSVDPAEAAANFGCHTVLWDRLFGTYRPAPREPLQVGVQPAGRRSLWQELAWPFYRPVS